MARVCFIMGHADVTWQFCIVGYCNIKPAIAVVPVDFEAAPPFLFNLMKGFWLCLLAVELRTKICDNI